MGEYRFWLKQQNPNKSWIHKVKMKPLCFFLYNVHAKEKHHECRQTVWKCLYKINMVLAVRWLSKSHNFITRNLNFEHTLKSNNWSYWKFIFHFIFPYSSSKWNNYAQRARARTHCIQSKGSKSISLNYTLNDVDDDDDENKGTQMKWNTQRLNY